MRTKAEVRCLCAGVCRKCRNPQKPASRSGYDGAADGLFCERNILAVGAEEELRLYAVPDASGYAQLMVPGFGSRIMDSFRKATAFSSPSSTDIRLSSCSMESTRS